jgi:hypothetical protein
MRRLRPTERRHLMRQRLRPTARRRLMRQRRRLTERRHLMQRRRLMQVRRLSARWRATGRLSYARPHLIGVNCAPASLPAHAAT